MSRQGNLRACWTGAVLDVCPVSLTCFATILTDARIRMCCVLFCRSGAGIVARCFWDFGRWSDLWRSWRPLPDSGASLQDCLQRTRTQEARGSLLLLLLLLQQLCSQPSCAGTWPFPRLACLPLQPAPSLTLHLLGLSFACPVPAGQHPLGSDPV